MKNLSFRRAGTPIFSDISMSVDPGEALVLRGPNGVGKTSLLRTLAAFNPPSAGQAELFGAKLEDIDEFQNQIAYAGHTDAIKYQMTVEENIRFWAKIFGSNKAREALEIFNLSGLRGRLAGKCSAGQKKRLGLARLLVSNRKLWLLDEPTVALDIASRAILASVITDHLQSGGIAVIATHDPDLIEATTLEMQPPSETDEASDDWGLPA